MCTREPDRKRIITKIFAALLAMLLAMALTPTAVMAGDVGIQNGLPAITANGTKETTTVVKFGGYEGFDGRWYVIGYDDRGVASGIGTMTLLAAAGMGGIDVFNRSSAEGNAYSTSYLRGQLTDKYEYPNSSNTPWRFTGIDERERALMDARALTDVGIEEPTDKLWPLSTAEANSVNNDLRNINAIWWLRSPGSNLNLAAVVLSGGEVHGDGLDVYFPFAVRPAFILNLSSVLFTSAAAGGKNSAVGTLSTASAPTVGPIKFTVEHSGLTLDSSVLTVAPVKAGDTVEIAYSNATTGTNKYVSCVIENDGGTVLFYGKLAQNLASGTASFTVPAAAALPDGDYTIRLFAEEANSDNMTDFCSVPIEIEMSVDNTPPTVSAIIPENNATGQNASGSIVITFNEDMNTAVTGSVTLNSESTAPGTWSSTGGHTDNTYTIAYSDLADGTMYTIKIEDFKDLAGNEMTAYSSSFKTTDPTPPHVPVTGITGVPSMATAGTGLALTGTVVPDDATNQTIEWSVSVGDAGTTGATIEGSTLKTTAAGTATVTATVVNGAAVSTNYTQDFDITVYNPVSDSPAPIIDLTKDAVITINGNFVDLEQIWLNDDELSIASTDTAKLLLSDYLNYNKTLGDAQSGSVKITLYKDFLATLPNGEHKLKASFKNGTEPYVPPVTPIVINRPSDTENGGGGGCNTGAGMAGIFAMVLAAALLKTRKVKR